MTARVESATQSLKTIFAVLAADVESARKYGQVDPSPFAHRTLFRTYFALIEGLCYQFRQVALACSEYDPTLLTPNEVVLLREQKISLNKKGLPEPTSEHQRLLPSILFSLRCYAKVHGTSFEPDTSDKGWSAMQEFIRIRNGLEHPKSMDDLELNEKQIENALAAAIWWKSTVLDLLEACRQADTYWRKELGDN